MTPLSLEQKNSTHWFARLSGGNLCGSYESRHGRYDHANNPHLCGNRSYRLADEKGLKAMVEIRLYGKLRRYLRDPKATRGGILKLSAWMNLR
jgi:hypothetical protein